MSGSNDHIDASQGRYGMASIGDAVQRLQQGDIVAVPTETVYGLAADSTNAAAVAQIYRTKGRPDFNPLIVHVPDLAAARRLGQFDPLAEKLAREYWPGALTLVVLKTDDCPVAPAVTAGLDTIALRCPAHPVMRELLNQSGLNLAAPSANASGGISPTTAAHVQRSLADNAPMILDGGPCQDGLESTIIAIRADGFQLLRPGPIALEALEAFTGLKNKEIQHLKIEAPGQLASHYAPSKPLRLNARSAAPDEYHIGFGPVAGQANLSATSDLAEAASNLFAFLHRADSSEQSAIAIAPLPHDGIGRAINDRLARAAAAS
ncbi:threonylcarbamoyl-AMP synthase [Sphingomonadales bacterium EhC05]|nr:threonylcarbamoyl-AMP synthase [Sphingomonadales bacterium EhC05]